MPGRADAAARLDAAGGCMDSCCQNRHCGNRSLTKGLGAVTNYGYILIFIRIHFVKTHLGTFPRKI